MRSPSTRMGLEDSTVLLRALIDRRRRRSLSSPHAAAPLDAPPHRPVTLGDLARDGKLLEVECSACRPSRHLYIEPLSLGLPKRLPVPDVADHLVCSVCGTRMSDSNGRYTRGRMREFQGDRQISAMVIASTRRSPADLSSLRPCSPYDCAGAKPCLMISRSTRRRYGAA